MYIATYSVIYTQSPIYTLDPPIYIYIYTYQKVNSSPNMYVG